jgi:hypothetical protein
MTKKFVGGVVLFVLLLCGQAQDARYRDTNLGNFNDDQIADWLLLLGDIGWVQWLKSEKMQVKHVDAPWKHRYIMFLVKKLSVGPKVWG